MKALRLLLCLGLAACADLETKTWYRVDGNPTRADQLDFDKMSCRAEMQKSLQITNAAAALDRDVVRTDVYDGCMARHGYSETNNQRASMPPVQGTAPPGVQTSAPPGVQGAQVPSAVQGGPTPPSDQPCRRAPDLRMWLPLCP